MESTPRFTTKLVLAAALLFTSACFLQPEPALAQTQEPEVMDLPQPKTPLSEGKYNTLGFEIMVTNFGFGIGGHYSRVIGPFTQLTFQTGITGLRDVSEQTYTDPFFGQQIIPNKYKRAMAFPFMVGLKKRFFARQISDNFRLFVSMSGGPVLAFVYPYVVDSDGNGYRTTILNQFGYPQPTERVNDFFTGWKNGDTQWGAAGELKVGVDIGENFSRLTTVEFGYYFNYFDQGIQMMEPYQPEGYDEQGFSVGQEPFMDAQKYFGTPQITLTFGGMW